MHPFTRPPLLRLAAVLLAAAGVVTASAQTTQQVTVNGIVPVLMNLTVDNHNVTLTFAQSDYDTNGDATKEAVNATTLKVASNTRWRLYVGANSQKFTFAPSAGGSDPGKNCGDLSLSPFNTTSYFQVTTGTKDIANGLPGGNTDAGHSIPVNYKLGTKLAIDPPGTYTLVLTYSLLAQ